MRLDDRVIEEIKNKANIVDVISRYINVIKKGNNYLAICPFHNDSNPSMNISESKQIYKCFSCGAGGNVFTFVSEYEKVGFIEAVSKVANMIGYDLSGYEIDTPKVDTKKDKLLRLLKDTMEFYNYNLLNSDNEGIKYLSERGITIDVIDNFKLGYAPSDSSKTLRYLTKKGYTVEERPLSIDELMEAAKTGKLSEAFGTGTAAVISPIGKLAYKDEVFFDNNKIGPISQMLYDTLTGIQTGKLEDTFGWTYEVK